MDKRWLDLRWPVTVLLLGAMGFVLLARSSRHPIQLRLEVSFSKPVTVGGPCNMTSSWRSRCWSA